MLTNRSIWLILLSTVLFFGAAVVTLRAAEQTSAPAAGTGERAANPSRSADDDVSFPTDI